MNTKFTPARKTDIVNQYWSGTSVKVLCELYHVPRSTLYAWLKPYKSVYASRYAMNPAVTQKDYNDLKRKYR